MSGGNGKDAFVFRHSSDNLLQDNGGLSVGDSVGAGATIFGVFAVVDDYRAGEIVDIGTTTLDADGPQIGGVNFQTHAHVIVDDDSYAFLSGELVDDGQSLVSDSGPDTLLIFDSDPVNEFYFEYTGSVVFLGVSDSSQITIGDSGHMIA